MRSERISHLPSLDPFRESRVVLDAFRLEDLSPGASISIWATEIPERQR